MNHVAIPDISTTSTIHTSSTQPETDTAPTSTSTSTSTTGSVPVPTSGDAGQDSGPDSPTASTDVVRWAAVNRRAIGSILTARQGITAAIIDGDPARVSAACSTFAETAREVRVLTPTDQPDLDAVWTAGVAHYLDFAQRCVETIGQGGAGTSLQAALDAGDVTLATLAAAFYAQLGGER